MIRTPASGEMIHRRGSRSDLTPRVGEVHALGSCAGLSHMAAMVDVRPHAPTEGLSPQRRRGLPPLPAGCGERSPKGEGWAGEGELPRVALLESPPHPPCSLRSQVDLSRRKRGEVELVAPESQQHFGGSCGQIDHYNHMRLPCPMRGEVEPAALPR